MKRKMFIGLLCLVLMSCFIPLVKAEDWVLVEKTGDWEKDGRTDYKSGWDCDLCGLIYERYNIQNFTAYLVEIHGHIISDSTFITTLWSEIIYVFNDNTNESYGIRLNNLKDVGISFFGLSWTNYACGIAFWDGSKWKGLRSESGNANIWRVRVFKSGNENLTFQVEGYISEGKCFISAEKTVKVSPNFFGNVSLGMIHSEESQSLFVLLNGQIEAQITDELLLTNLPPQNYTLESEAEWHQTVLDYLWQLLTGVTQQFQPIAQWFGQLWVYINYALSFLGQMFSYATAFIPILVSMFGVWICFFTIQNLAELNMTPIVEVFVGIYQFFANLITMFINVIEAIYEKIKFW
jgi:hypothetical protein